MKRRNILLLGFSLAGLFGIGLSSLGSLASNKPLIGMNATEQTYKFLFDKSSNKPVIDGNGSLNVLSSLGNSFKFDYSSFLVSEGNWGKLAANGTLLNPYTSTTYKNAIGNISSITVVFTGDLTIDYGWGGKDGTVNYLRTNHKLTSGIVFGFAAEMPNYIRIKATSETTITSITLNYRCGTNNNFNEAFQITSVQTLKDFASLTKSGQTNLNARLVNDIDFKDETFTGIGNVNNHYKGTFDGNGKTVSNIKIVNKAEGAGLFNYVEGATISNLNIDNIRVNSETSNTNCSAALVGYCYGANINNINIASGTLYGKGNTGSIIGYVCKVAGKTTINNVKNFANVISNGAIGVGGLVGTNETPAIIKISNSINYGSVTSKNDYVGGITGLLRKGTNNVKPSIENCINYGKVKGAKNVGGIAGGNRGSITNCKVGSTAIINDKAPSSIKNISGTGGYLIGTNDTGGGAITADEIAKYNYSPIWDPVTTKTAFVGSGTQEDPYKIEYAEDLAYLANSVNSNASYNSAKKYYQVITNIDLGGNNWTPIGTLSATIKNSFKGNFDGGNLIIDGLKIEQSLSDIGLFGYTNGAKVSNINLRNVDIKSNATGPSYTAALIGRALKSTISNITLEGNINANGKLVGGIIGGNHGSATSTDDMISTISNCINKMNVTSTDDEVGGIIGGNQYVNVIHINDCINKGNIVGKNMVGGIIGIVRFDGKTKTQSILDNCSNYGNITVTGTMRCGGIAGYNIGIINRAKVLENCTLTLNGETKLAKDCKANSGFDAVASMVARTAGKGVINNWSTIAEDESISSINNYTEWGYGRIIKLSDESYFFTSDLATSSATSLEGLKRTQALAKNDFIRDKNGNNTTTSIQMGNAQPIEYANGKIAIFYRAGGTYGTSYKYSSIRVRISTDNGKTFGEPQILLENITSTAGKAETEGLYEPFPVLKEDRNIELFISCDITSTVNGNDSLKALSGRQNIIRMPISVSNDTFTTGTAIIINNLKGTTNYHRPGMTTISKLNDGSYIMAMERTNELNPNTTKIGFTICISYSKDLINWTLPKEIIRPKTTNSVVTENYLCQSPCIGVLDNGKIAVSYMSNENFQGDNYINGNSFFRRCEVAISEKEVKYSDSPTMIKQDNSFGYANNIGCQYPGLYVEGNTAYTIERTYIIAVNDSGNVSLSNKKTVIKPFVA